MSGFVEGLVQSIPVIGLFLVLFAIFHFVASIFFARAQATALAVVLSIYPFINIKIYNYLLSLNAFTVGLLVFLAMVIMIWGLTKHGIERTKEENDLIKKMMSDPKIQEDKKNIEELKKLIGEYRKNGGHRT